MSKNISKINDFRMEFSSSLCKYDNNIKNYFKITFIKDKVINLNNFKYKFNNKIIKYSLFYSCPYTINNKISNKIKLLYNNDNNIKNICDKIFIDKINLKNLNSYENKIISKIILRKYNNDNYIDFRSSLIILWYVIISSNFIVNKELSINTLKEYYIDYISNKFKISKIIIKIFKNDNIESIKINMSLYILLEEFHYKYSTFFLKKINLHKKIIMNSSYININPFDILTNNNGEYFESISSIIDTVKYPFGHNIIFIFNNNILYYYDSDEQDYSDIFIFKKFFLNFNINFINISLKEPIQTICDDGNCIFYCLRLVEYLDEYYDYNLSLRLLQKIVYNFENNIYTNNDMNKWILNFIDDILYINNYHLLS